MSSTISSYQATLLTSSIDNNQLLFPIAGQTAGATPIAAGPTKAATAADSGYVAPQSAVAATATPAATTTTGSPTTGTAASGASTTKANDGYAGQGVLSAASRVVAPSATASTATQNPYQQAYDNGLVSNDEILLAPIVGPYGIGSSVDTLA